MSALKTLKTVPSDTPRNPQDKGSYLHVILRSLTTDTQKQATRQHNKVRMMSLEQYYSNTIGILLGRENAGPTEAHGRVTWQGCNWEDTDAPEEC